MAAPKLISSFWPVLLLLCLHWSPAQSVRTKTKIYLDLDTQSACFRHLNGTHQLGCASSQSGNVGVLFYIERPEDFDWVLSDGPHAPYIALLNSADFTGPNVRRLYKRTDRVAGIMVISLLDSDKNSTEWSSQFPEDGFSSSDSCPNDMSGLYRDSEDYGSCKKTTWNPPGSGLMREDLGIPMFVLSEKSDVDKVLQKCFFKFNSREKNETSRTYPLCAAELSVKMHAAVDTVTCLRRSEHGFSLQGTTVICDPLGDQNNHVTLMDTPQNETRADNSVIVVGARMDTSAMFTLEYRSSDSSVAGIVCLLAAMEALWKTKDTIKKTKNAKDIMFAFFQGEAYDYIGSSRMVYNMQQGKFPNDPKSFGSSDIRLQNIGLNHINQFVELNQVGRRDDAGSLWMHTDPDSHKAQKQQIQAMIDGLKAATKDLDLSLQEADEIQPLPPASSQRFLMERKDIPVIVITDHQNEFTNKFYNSRLDVAELINATDYPPDLTPLEKYDHVTTQAKLLANLSTTLARYLYEASTGSPPDDATKEILTANSSTVTHLLYCFLVSPNCPLFNELSDIPISPDKELSPYPFYVGIAHDTVTVTNFVYHLTAKFSGDRLDLSESDCKAKGADKRYTYSYFQGSGTGDGFCVKSLVQMTEAVSPAFVIDGYDMKSGKYSTWAESRWAYDSIKVRLFLVPSQELQKSILASGVVVLVLSLLLVYWCNAHAGQIFSQRNSGASGAQTTYTPMF